MIVYLTACIYSTCSRTGVDTLVSLTCFVRWTVGVDHTFWTTCDIWVPKILGYTLTCCCSVSCLTNSIGSTWSWIFSQNNYLFKKRNEVYEKKSVWHQCPETQSKFSLEKELIQQTIGCFLFPIWIKSTVLAR